MRKQLTIRDMQIRASARRGKCLSRVYLKSSSPLQWECQHGHTWMAPGNKIQQGKWCPRCAGKGKTIAEMREAAHEKGGACLSAKYDGMQGKLRWRCASGHIFSATPNMIMNQGAWCRKCGILARTLSPREKRCWLERMKKLARARGGACLSVEYADNRTLLLWRCSNGHEWYATPSHVMYSGTWCATCCAGISERMCRAIIEKLFKTSFPKSKPVWLISDRGTRLELDGYAKELKMAFEYHGAQHFVESRRFHSARQTLARRRKDDDRKRELCREHDVLLVEIPYTIQHHQIEQYIREQVDGHHTVPLATAIPLTSLNAYVAKPLGELKALAAQRGGRCLTMFYVNNSTKMEWRCRKGHVWRTAPEVIKMGHWCPDCAGNRRLTLGHMQALALRKGGECLSTQYKGYKSKLHWRCAKGHEWMAKPDNIASGRWCPRCSPTPHIFIEDVQALAASKGGRCLSTRYVNAHTLMRFRCAIGHEWTMSENKLQQGRWCPQCNRKRKEQGSGEK